MKKRIGSLLLAVVCGFLLTANTAQAALIQAGNTEWYFNDTTNLYWYSDVASFVSLDYASAETAVAGLSVNGARLATRVEVLDLLNVRLDRQKVGSLFTATGANTGGDPFITGRTSTPSGSLWHNTVSIQYHTGWAPGYEWAVPATGVFQDVSSADSLGAWVVTATDPTAVPEPASLFLLGSGLVGLSIMAKKTVKQESRD